MSKEDLIKNIKDLKLEAELESLIMELIDNASEVNQELLDSIADMLDLQADIDDKLAGSLEEAGDQQERQGV